MVESIAICNLSSNKPSLILVGLDLSHFYSVSSNSADLIHRLYNLHYKIKNRVIMS